MTTSTHQVDKKYYMNVSLKFLIVVKFLVDKLFTDRYKKNITKTNKFIPSLGNKKKCITQFSKRLELPHIIVLYFNVILNAREKCFTHEYNIQYNGKPRKQIRI